MPHILINPLRISKTDRLLLRALTGVYPEDQVFQKSKEYTVDGKRITLTHSLVKHQGKDGQQRLLIINDDDKSALVGSGSFSQVYISNHTFKADGRVIKKAPQQERIVKFQNMSNIEKLSADSELSYLELHRQGSQCAEALAELHHKREIIDTTTDQRVEIERRFPGMTLHDFSDFEFSSKSPAYLTGLEMDELFILTWNLLAALRNQATEQGIVHRDIKTDNILVDPKTLNVWLIDFGFAIPVNNPQYTHFKGNFMLVGPELCHSNAPPTPLSDIFLMGKVLQAVWTRHKWNNVKHKDLVFESLRAFLNDMTNDDVTKRIDVHTALGRIHAIRMEYLLKEQMKNLEARKHRQFAFSTFNGLQQALHHAAIHGYTEENRQKIIEATRTLKNNPKLAENRGLGNLLAVITNIAILVGGLGVIGYIALHYTAEKRGSFFWRPKTRSVEQLETIENLIEQQPKKT